MRVRLFGVEGETTRVAHENLLAALRKVGVSADIESVDKIDEITMFGVLETPAVMVGERMVCEGKIPTVEELAVWLLRALEANQFVSVH